MENKKCFGINDNDNTTYLNLRDAATTVLRGKLIVANAYLKKEKITHINSLAFYCKIQENDKMDNPLPRLTKHKERTQMTKFSNEKGDITTDITKRKEI